MCRIGSHQDIHGIGVANLIFGIACIILPGHTMWDSDNDFGYTPSDLFKATDAITVINGLFFLAAGIVGMVVARRLVEDLTTFNVMRALLVLSVVCAVICPATFILNAVATSQASNLDFTSADAGDSTNGPVGNITIDLQTLFTGFMYFSRFVEYNYGVSASLALIGIGAFFMNITQISIIFKQRQFKFFGPSQEVHLTGIPGDTRIAYGNMNNDGAPGSVVIQPLPTRPGPQHG